MFSFSKRIVKSVRAYLQLKLLLTPSFLQLHTWTSTIRHSSFNAKPAASLRFRFGSRDEAHGQAVLVLHRLLRQVVGLPDAVEGAASTRTHCVPRQQCHQDGLHHHHGDVFAHTRPRPAAEGLEETTGHLSNRGGKDRTGVLFFLSFFVRSST